MSSSVSVIDAASDAASPVDFTGLYGPYATYTPSLQKPSAQFPLRARRATDPAHFYPAHLDFLSGNSGFWTCKNILYSAGQFNSAVISPPDIVSRNRANNLFVVGDSGGYQVATGSWSLTNHLKALGQNPAAVKKAWKSDTRALDTSLRWLDLNCDYGMTLDIPLWILNQPKSSSPFAKMAEVAVHELNDFNLDYFAQNRGRVTGKRAKLLNVLHDIGGGSGDRWYKAVTSYLFEGWALGSDTAKDLPSILYWLQRLKMDGLLDNAEVIHILKASPPLKSVWFTAIQNRLRELLGTNIRLTYDSSSPFQNGGRYEQYALMPNLTADVRTWSIRSQPFPQGPQFVSATTPTFIPNPASPILKAFSVNDLHEAKGAFAQKHLSQTGQHILINHNLYIYHHAAINACDLVFHPTKRDPKRIPQQLQADLALIQQTLK